MDDYELLKKDIAYIKCAIDEIKRDLETKYVTRVEFEPIRKIVLGTVGMVLVSFVGAIIALIIKS